LTIKLTNIGEIATWDKDTNSLRVKHNQEIYIHGGLIMEVGENLGEAEEEIDVDGALVTPGFIDSHTHPIFHSNRSQEFSQRVEGKSYEDIASSGGGIISSITSVRNASEDELYESSLENVQNFIFHGTTTLEAKSGYGLTVEDELKSLRVIKRLNRDLPIDIIPTFLGAHAFPPEFTDDHDGYVDLICNEMIPAVASENLAVFCDVFCEKGYFTVDQSVKILETGIKHGLTPRIHADEFIDSGAAELAAEMGAVSADHLMAVSDKGIAAMKTKNVIATLLPGTTLFLGKQSYADGKRMVNSGLDVAIATDFNPGSSTLPSMPLAMSLAVLYCGLTIPQAFCAATWIPAKSLHVHHKTGLIKKGFNADLLIWNCNHVEEIPYWLGSDRIMLVMKAGEIIHEK